MSEETFEIVSDVIQRRQTWKLLASPDAPVIYPDQILAECDRIVSDAIAVSGWAPFHYDRGSEDIPEPWRVYIVNCHDCRNISQKFPQLFDNVKPGNKLPAMLSACGCLLLVTWIPQFRDEIGDSLVQESKQKQTQIDDEHLAATAAMVQNLLLLLTAAELGTYWSSGGQLGSETMFDLLAIPQNEQLLAAVFVEYHEGSKNVQERIGGKHRSRRTPASKWCKSVSFPNET